MLTYHQAPRVLLLCLHPLLWPLLLEPQSALILGDYPEDSPHIIGLMEGAWWTFFKWSKDSSLWLSCVPFWLFKFVITHSAIQLCAALFWLFVALFQSVIYHSLHSVYVQLIVKLVWSVICHTLHSVYVQWISKRTKISLTCIVVLQDPVC